MKLVKPSHWSRIEIILEESSAYKAIWVIEQIRFLSVLPFCRKSFPDDGLKINCSNNFFTYIERTLNLQDVR